jgi:DsbC/DsbD-like thiol-disulfide interchange protein
MRRVKISSRENLALGVAARITIALAMLSVGAEAATNVIVTDNARASLVSDVAAVKPGTAFWVGLHLKLRPRWHTYWLNPGDSGLAPRIEWRLPEGLVAGAIRYPLPHRILTGALATYGYDDEVVLLTRMSALPALRARRELMLHAHAYWLVCEKICLPQEGELEFRLPVGANATPASTKPLIDRYVARVPVATPESSFNTSDAQLHVRVRLSGDAANAKRVLFYPTEFSVLAHAAEQTWRRVDDYVELTVARGELKNQALERLDGVLAVVDASGIEHGYVISALPR